MGPYISLYFSCTSEFQRFFPLTHVKNNLTLTNSFGCFHSGILHYLIVHSSVNSFVWPARNERHKTASELRCLEIVIFGGT